MTPLSLSIPNTLEKLLSGLDLDSSTATELMEAWLSEEVSPVQTGALLSAFRTKGVSGFELASMAKVLRNATTLPCELPSLEMVDTCGTGGDGADTFNISTAVAFTAAACGVTIAKHGNRSASGKVGSADVIESIGIDLKAPLEKVVKALPNANVTFLFAPAWHPALVNLAPLRKDLGVRTVFNLLGPLVNPFRPSAQVLGVAKPELLDPMAQALKELGSKRAVVVYGYGGLDEASLEGVNQLRFLEDGEISDKSLNPSDLGIELSSNQKLKGGDIDCNKMILTSVLQGKGPHAHENIVALNTALVLWAANVESDLSIGFKTALSSIKEASPWERLKLLRTSLSS